MNTLFNNRFIVRIKTFALAHKIATAIIVLVFGYGGYHWYASGSSTVETRYVLGAVTKQTIITSISGTGQVSASTQIDLKPKSSGDIVYLGVTNGQEVKAGTLIASLDATQAQKAVRDAQVSLDSAKLSLAKLVQPADALSMTQDENALARAKQSKENAVSNLASSYDDGFNTISNVFLDLPTTMAGLQDILFGTTQQLDINVQNIEYYTSTIYRFDDVASKSYHDDAYAKYQKARAAYDQNFADYKAASRSSSTSTVETLIAETYTTMKQVSDAVKSANNLIQQYQDKLTAHSIKPAAISTTQLTSLNAYTKNTDGYISTLGGTISTIKNDKDTMSNADLTIAENTQSLAKLKSGADPLDVQSSQLSITQRENALRDAQETLANYYVRAPFDGTVAKLGVSKGDAASSGTIIATFITKQKIATISLNEVDAAKVKVGQKVTLSFDAVDGLTLTGAVASIDTVGTVSQGVVTYNVQISFDTQDDRVKSGMSVSAAIITDVHQDVLAVPSAAIKSQGNSSSVQIVAGGKASTGTALAQGEILATAPRNQTVEVGISNDTMTEVTSGLKEGDVIVTKTITSGATAAKTTPTVSLFGGGGGGAFRRGG